MDERFTIDGARAAATAGELRQWVADFLASPGSDNAELGAQLQRTYPWWLGPVELPIDQLQRLAGPPGQPVLETLEEDEWRDDVDDLAAGVAEGELPAPVVVTYHDGQLHLEDGNHRVEAIRRAGADRAWSVVGFDDEPDLDRFLAGSGGANAPLPRSTPL
jgi:hypothetical protein